MRIALGETEPTPENIFVMYAVPGLFLVVVGRLLVHAIPKPSP